MQHKSLLLCLPMADDVFAHGGGQEDGDKVQCILNAIGTMALVDTSISLVPPRVVYPNDFGKVAT